MPGRSRHGAAGGSERGRDRSRVRNWNRNQIRSPRWSARWTGAEESALRTAAIPAADRPDAVDLQEAKPSVDPGLAAWLGPLQVFGLSAVLALFTWLLGFATALYVAPPDVVAPAGAPERFSLFNEAWRWVDLEFYGEPPLPHARAAHAVSGLVEALDDPYAAYVNRDQLRPGGPEFLTLASGGLGGWLEMVAEGALVVSTVLDAPLARAGVHPGDLIVAADEEPLAGLSMEEALALLDGPAGSSVSLVLLRQRERAELLEVVRDRVAAPGFFIARPAPQSLHLRLDAFSTETLAALDHSLSELAPASVDLILDLRDNPGGPLNLVPDFLGRFMSRGLAYVEVDRDGARREHRVRPPDQADLGAVSSGWANRRIAVLINEGTASAAEMVAAALREQAGARIVGRRSFGKGSIQGLVRLSDGSLLRLTVARWESGSGLDVSGSGLLPDLHVDSVAATAADDPILEAALRALDDGLLWLEEGA